MRHLILHLFTIVSVTALLVSCKEKHIEEEPVTQVTIYPSSFTMVEGESRKVEVVILPQNASYGSVKWVSSNNRIVSVTDGTVSALAPGSAEITAIAGGIPGKSVVTVEAKQIPVEAVHLSQESMELTEGDASQLTATVLPENASNKNVRWESTNTDVATVNNGKVTAVKAGSAAIKVITEDGSKTAECSVTVNAKVYPVTSVSLDKTSLTLTEGDASQLTATVLPENASNKNLRWESTNTGVATVNNGKVTAVKAGSAAIKVITEDGSKTAECSVTVNAKVYPVTSVSLDKTSLTLTEGDVAQLTATVLPENASNKNLRWESTNTGVATVNNGKVTAVKAGSAAIKVITEDGSKTAECSVTVNAKVYPVTSVSLDKTSLTLTEGDVAQLTATVLPENASNKNLRWESTNTGVATVNNGKVTAVKAGSAAIKVFTEDGSKTAECSVTVNAKVYPVTSVSLDKTSLTLTEGDVAQLTATVLPENASNKNVRWESTNTGVATVNNGKVTAVKAGSAAIKVFTEDGSKTAECSVTVNAKVYPVTSVSLDKTSLTLTEGNVVILTATVLPENASNKNVSWTSSNSDVATVSQDGQVTAVSAGTATIRVVTTDGGKVAECAIIVNHLYVPVTGVSIEPSSAAVAVGKTIQLAATVSPSNADEKDVTWESSDESIAKVNNEGVVYGIAVGKVEVKAKVGTYSATSSIEVAIPLEKVILEKTDFELFVGDAINVKWTNVPENANVFYYTITSSNPRVADYSWFYNINAKSVGEAIMTWTATTPFGKDITADCHVVVRQPVSSISLNLESLSLLEGKSATLAATILPEDAYNKNVCWTSDNPNVAAVDSKGKITGVTAGSTTIWATTEQGSKKASCSVTVESKIYPVADVSLDKSSITLTEGGIAQLTATVLPENASNKNVRWESTNTGVATVNNGKVTAVKAGSAAIKVITEDGNKTAECSVTVNAKVYPVTSVSLDKASLTLTEGDVAQLTATVLPENATNKNVRWESTNTDVATVNNGRVVAYRAGSATIKVITEDGNKTAECSVTVNAKVYPVTSVSLDKTSLTLTEGNVVQLTATVLPENASNKNVRWESTNTGVATVNNGKVTAVKAGSATIKVITEDGSKTAECSVTVNAKVYPVTSVSLDKTSLTLTEGDVAQLTATVLPENASNKNIRWESTNTGVATVNNGKVTAVKKGSAKIRVITEDGNKTAECDVTVKPKTVNGGFEGIGEEEW